MRIALASLVLVLVLAAGAIVVVVSVPLSPSAQKVEQLVPDEKLPH